MSEPALEALARALSRGFGYDPDVDCGGIPMWRTFIHHVDRSIAALADAGFAVRSDAEVAAAVAAEREACAQVAAGYPATQHGNMAGNPEEAARDTADEIAAAIRARGAAR
jgi:hypothetical protein